MAAFVTTIEGNITVLAVAGRLEPMGGKDLRDTLEALSNDSKDLLVDLENLDYMASAGFRELFLVGRKLGRQGARLAVCGLQGEVRRVFELAKFDTAYPIYTNRAVALTEMGQVS
jgi:anti-anti-sigma factor